MTYVDGFVIPVPKQNIESYRQMAEAAGAVWREHGALTYFECVAEDLETPCGIPFQKLAAAKDDETVVFAFITYESRAHRDAVNAKVMADPRIAGMCPDPMPFDVSRMTFGGFQAIVEA